MCEESKDARVGSLEVILFKIRPYHPWFFSRLLKWGTVVVVESPDEISRRRSVCHTLYDVEYENPEKADLL